MMTAEPCEHMLAVKDDFKVCMLCGKTFGAAYDAARMVEDVKRILNHRAAYVTLLRKAFEEAATLEDQREIVVREMKRLTTQQTHVSAAENLKTLEAVLKRFDTYYADHALPRIR